MSQWSILLAQAGSAAVPAAPGAAGGGESMMPMVITMGLVVAIFYFMLIRPQQRKEKERKQLVDNIKSGERVLFAGGLIGTIANVKEQTFIIKISDTVKIEVARGAVTQVLEKGDKIIEDEKK